MTENACKLPKYLIFSRLCDKEDKQIFKDPSIIYINLPNCVSLHSGRFKIRMHLITLFSKKNQRDSLFQGINFQEIKENNTILINVCCLYKA